MNNLIVRGAVALVMGAISLVPVQAAPMRQASGTLTVWHAWTGAEQDALQRALGAFQSNNPDLQLNLLQVPFDQLKNKFTLEASTGGGPDLLIGPKDWIGELAQANLIQSMDTVAPDLLATLNPAAVTANSYRGQVWALPESTEAVALFYNPSLVPSPPTSVDELLSIAASTGVGVNSGFYHFSGFIFASGGQLFDDSQRIVLNQNAGTASALSWLWTARNSQGVTVDADGSKLDALFKDRRIGMVFNGPWATGDYVRALGRENVAIAPPIRVSETGTTFAPFLGTKNVFLSANAQNQEAAVAFMRYLVSADVQTTMAETAGHIPSNPAALIADPVLAGFLAQTQSATYFPNEPEMGAVWTPASDMITKVIEGRAEPAVAVEEATETINRANRKS